MPTLKCIHRAPQTRPPRRVVSAIVGRRQGYGTRAFPGESRSCCPGQPIVGTKVWLLSCGNYSMPRKPIWRSRCLSSSPIAITLDTSIWRMELPAQFAGFAQLTFADLEGDLEHCAVPVILDLTRSNSQLESLKVELRVSNNQSTADTLPAIFDLPIEPTRLGPSGIERSLSIGLPNLSLA